MIWPPRAAVLHGVAAARLLLQQAPVQKTPARWWASIAETGPPFSRSYRRSRPHRGAAPLSPVPMYESTRPEKTRNPTRKTPRDSAQPL